jgi:hypothetical protein
VGTGTVSIAGWTVDNNSIRINTLGASGSMWLCRGGTTTSATIGGSNSISGWSIAVGTTFGVTAAGALYASNLYASGGTIAGWTISAKYGIHASYKVAMVNPSTATSGLKRISPISSTTQAMVFYAHTEDPDNDEGYPNFCVLADGAMFATGATISGTITASGGKIGSDLSTGQLFVNGSQTVAGDTSGTSVCYFQKGTSTSLNLTEIKWGIGVNDFFLGSGGLIMRNPNFVLGDTSSSPYRGLRLTSSGLFIEGSNRSQAVAGKAL